MRLVPASDCAEFPVPAGSASDYPVPAVLTKQRLEFTWDCDAAPHEQFPIFGAVLARCGDLWRMPRYGSGLLLAPQSRSISPVAIITPAHLAAIIVDRMAVRCVACGQPAGSHIPAADLKMMLASELFLRHFRPVDLVTSAPKYLPHFELTRPGFNDGGPGNRVFYVGESPAICRTHATTVQFLDAMAFATSADRTNTLAGALTVLLRNFWSGGKPLMLVTANKSHAGKGTVVDFVRGAERSTEISYQPTDWALERAFVGALAHHPGTAVINVDNARLGRGQHFIASAYLERFLTDSEPLLFSTGSGGPRSRPNNVVVAITTNFGSVSADLLNRSLPINLAPTGDIESRQSSIGNPKLEFLPANRAQIEAELLGMVERWKSAGSPLDLRVRHPFIHWAQTIGGILRANGFEHFLENYGPAKTVHDPVRVALGAMGAAQPGLWLTASEWAKVAGRVGVLRTLVGAADLESEPGRARGMGVTLSGHAGETIGAETDDDHLTMSLARARLRFDGAAPSTRYRFEVITRSPIPCDDGPSVIPQAAPVEHDTPHMTGELGSGTVPAAS